MRRAHLGRMFDVKRMRARLRGGIAGLGGFLHFDRTDSGSDRANRIMPVKANHPSAAIRKRRVPRSSPEMAFELRLDRLGDQLDARRFAEFR